MTTGIGESLAIAGIVILPCLGILITGGIIELVIVLIRKNRKLPSSFQHTSLEPRRLVNMRIHNGFQQGKRQAAAVDHHIMERF